MPNDDPAPLIRSGYQARRENRPDDARRLFAAAVEAGRALPDRSVLAAALIGLGEIERDLKNNPQAFQHYQEAADIHRALPDPLRFAHTIRHLADILRHEGSFPQAQACYEEALAIYCGHSEADTLDLANTIRGFALLTAAAGKTEQAVSLWREARDLYSKVNVPAGVQESDEQIKRLAAS